MHRYRALLALPGARAPMLLSIAGSMPIGMFGLAILLLVRDTTGSFAEAGRVLGAFSIANACGAVAQGRLMDRLGQGPVLRTVASLHLPALIALVIAAHEHAPAGVLFLFALCGGATLAQLPAAMRSLWTTLAESDAQRETAYAVVTIAFEVAVVTAPAIVAGIVAVASPAAAVVTAATLGTGSALAFTFTGASRRWRGVRHEVGWLGPLVAPGMRTVFVVLIAFGTAVGVVQVAVPAFALARGSDSVGGVLLAALSLGSLCGGLVYGSRNWPGRLAPRLATAPRHRRGVQPARPAERLRLARPAARALRRAVLAPTVVICSTLLDTVAPPGTATEAFAVTIMAIVAGTAIGNALGGNLVESASYDAAVLAAAGVAAAGSGVVLLRRRTLA